MSSLRLSEIWIYPIKSLSGIHVNEATVLNKGLQFDRRWMLVDEHNRFLTQREYPQMALFQVNLNDQQLHILHRKNSAAIEFPAFATAGSEHKATIWNDEVTTLEPLLEASAWFSEQLNMSCRLVHFPEINPRPVDPNYATNQEHVSLADAYPFLVIGQASLDDLNTRLASSVPIKRFRPNFVFTGGKPYEEDSWKDFSIGEINFTGVKNCARCVLTTVDPETGTKGKEPLATLSQYRNMGNKILFGQNAVARTTGTVRVNDPITVYPI
jgi:uncharacterized protein YcbX